MLRKVLLVCTVFELAGCVYRNRELTPLVSAARDGRADLILALVKNGADPNARCGVNQWTPLLHAIHKQRLESVRALLDAGADINCRDPHGKTALMMAAGYGYTDIVNLLLDRGADAHARLSDGTNALSLAILGVPDIDRFTIGDCQLSTVRTLVRRVPDLRLTGQPRLQRALESAKIKGCGALAALSARELP